MNNGNKELGYLLFFAVLAWLLISSCGVMTPVPLDDLPTPANTAGAIKAHTQPANEKVTICGRWNIRPSAGDLSRSLGWLEDEDVDIKIPATVTEDMGLWYELVEGGWVNARAECEAK